MAVEELIQKMVCRRQIGLTTIARKDKIWGSRLQTAIARGTDELVFWGLGPDLQVGDVVALYITDNRFVSPQDRKSLSRLYSIAAIVPGGRFRNHVFLHRCVEIEPLTYAELTRDPLRLKPHEFYNAGRISEPWPSERCREFWSLVLSRQPGLEESIRSRLLEAAPQYEIAMSYAGEDWTQAMRLKRWCESGGWNVFFATSTDILAHEEKVPLKILLRDIFGNAKVGVFLTPRPISDSEWIQLERLAATSSQDTEILFLRTDRLRKWPTEKQLGTTANGITRMEFEPPHEEEVYKRINELLRRRAPPKKQMQPTQ